MKAFRWGKPYETDAVVIKAEVYEAGFKRENWECSTGEGEVVFKRKISEEDMILGLGEQLGGINKKGRIYITHNFDIPEHTPDQKKLYGAHPFIIIKGKTTEALFIDYPGEIIFDVCFSERNKLQITIKSEHFDLYHWCNNNWQEIVVDYIRRTGGVYIPPQWAFGYQQCRWSYPDAAAVKEIAAKFIEHEIPCDAIYLDIDYMQDYKVFTVNEDRFGRLEKLSAQLGKDGFHLVPIIDPGVKVEAGYDVFEEGKEKGYFCVDKAGREFHAAVWPGITALPDFSQQEVRYWWGRNYDKLIALGIEGFWNDMNEPAVFYTDKQQQKVYDRLKTAAAADKIEELNLIDLHWQIKNFHNSREDYQNIYQQPQQGQTVCHDEIHNIYGAQMTRSLAEHVQTNHPEKRFLIFSRSSYSGMQRYAGIWYGDNKSWWQHLELNIKMLVNCNLLGFLYSGADIGGFGSDCEGELLLRWLQLGVFSPLMRNHSAIYTRRQELWEFDAETLNISRNIIKLRYAFLPILHSEYLYHAKNNLPLIRALSWDFADKRCEEIEDQIMYGSSILAAPVYKSNSRGRYVYLPQSRWLLWAAGSWDKREMQVMECGDHYLSCPLECQLIFIREDHLIAIQKPGRQALQKVSDNLIITGLVNKEAELKLYIDSIGYPVEISCWLKISIRNANEQFEIEIETPEPSLIQYHNLIFELYDVLGGKTIIKKTI